MENQNVNPGRWVKGTSLSCRAVLLAELVVLLLGAVVLTVMPEESLAALVAASQWAHGMAATLRPAVALVGLMSVGLLSWAVLSLWRRQSVAAELVSDEAQLLGGEEREPLRPAA